ncbi:hypothetical protein [Nitrosopumilus ureiphilus]|uniref:hypothetical protein n=1 Tax=Nitrosopumilus ureiphilus TaxID=1470067 RepID=UPI0015C77A41|nr:hypothetical protein [Nitrosopumilus ureiphilus]
MKSRLLIIIIIVILIISIMISLNFLLTLPQFGSEHCPGLELRKSLGLVDPNAACL